MVDNRLPAPSRNDPLNYNPLPCCGVALPVAGATPRRSAESMLPITPALFILLGSFGAIVFGLWGLWRADFKRNYPSPVMIAMQLSVLVSMTGTSLDNQNRANNSDISEILSYFYPFVFLIILLTIGLSYRRIHRLLPKASHEEINKIDAEQ